GEPIAGSVGQVFSPLPGKGPGVRGTTPRVRAAFFDGDGRRIFIVRARETSDSSAVESVDTARSLESGGVAVLDPDSMQEMGVFLGHRDEVTAGGRTPDGTPGALAC